MHLIQCTRSMNVCKTWSDHKHGFGCDTQCCGLEEIIRVPILLMTALTEPGERSYCSNSYTVMDIGVTDATHNLNAWPTKKDYIRMVWFLRHMGSISTTLFIWILDFDSGLHCVLYISDDVLWGNVFEYLCCWRVWWWSRLISNILELDGSASVFINCFIRLFYVGL